MVKVVLIGDSIRMGYQATVKKELEGAAEVWGPQENGGDSANVLGHLGEWVVSRRPEVVHLNCGLHDLKTNPENGEKQVPLEVYRKNMEGIFSGIHSDSPGAKVIWATTTPVKYEWHHENKPFDRVEKDVEEYNAAALEIAERYGAAINDLFALVTVRGKEELLLPDGVHFKEEGYELLGRAAAEAVRNAL